MDSNSNQNKCTLRVFGQYAMTEKLPQGYRAAGVYTGVKRNPTKKDLSLFVSDAPATAVGVYTQNLVVAAPVKLCRLRTPSKSIRAVVANSGVANACTGDQGDKDAHFMAAKTAQTCGVDAEEVLVMSTGVIGEMLPMDKISAGIDEAFQAYSTPLSSRLSKRPGES